MLDLTDFLKKKKEEQERGEIDWEKRKKEWLSELDGLYSRIREWINDAVQNDLLSVREETIALHEDFIGTYEAPQLNLVSNSEEVEIRPRGTLIIGSNGRVDMVSSKGSFMFVYLSPEPGWVYVDKTRRGQREPLTEALFIELLEVLLS